MTTIHAVMNSESCFPVDRLVTIIEIAATRVPSIRDVKIFPRYMMSLEKYPSKPVFTLSIHPKGLDGDFYRVVLTRSSYDREEIEEKIVTGGQEVFIQTVAVLLERLVLRSEESSSRDNPTTAATGHRTEFYKNIRWELFRMIDRSDYTIESLEKALGEKPNWLKSKFLIDDSVYLSDLFRIAELLGMKWEIPKLLGGEDE